MFFSEGWGTSSLTLVPGVFTTLLLSATIIHYSLFSSILFSFHYSLYLFYFLFILSQFLFITHLFSIYYLIYYLYFYLLYYRLYYIICLFSIHSSLLSFITILLFALSVLFIFISLPQVFVENRYFSQYV